MPLVDSPKLPTPHSTTLDYTPSLPLQQEPTPIRSFFDEYEPAIQLVENHPLPFQRITLLVDNRSFPQQETTTPTEKYHSHCRTHSQPPTKHHLGRKMGLQALSFPYSHNWMQLPSALTSTMTTSSQRPSSTTPYFHRRNPPMHARFSTTTSPLVLL